MGIDNKRRRRFVVLLIVIAVIFLIYLYNISIKSSEIIKDWNKVDRQINTEATSY